MLFLNAAICAIFYVAQLYFFWQGNQLGLSIGLPENHVFFKFIEEQQRSMNLIFLTTIFAVSALIIMFGLVYSHKIAGPLFHLKKHLKARIAGEKVRELKFREGDNFCDIAEVVNDYINHKEKDAPAERKSKRVA